jgi:hypothetical protein
VEFSINLLPQSTSKEEKRSLFLVPVLGVITVVAATAFLMFSYFDTKRSVETLTESIATQTTERDQLLNEYQQKKAGVSEVNYRDKYIKLNQVLSTTYVETIDLQNKLEFLLPVKAKVNAYTYSNSGELLTTIAFYSKGDAAIFLNRLLNADFVEQAEVEIIAAEEGELTYQAMFNVKLNSVVGEKE